MDTERNRSTTEGNPDWEGCTISSVVCPECCLSVERSGGHTELVADDGEQDGSQAPANDEPAPPAKTTAVTKAKTWRAWTIVVAALLAGLVSLLLLAGDLLAEVLSNLGGPAPIATFQRIAVFGHAALALASAFLFGLGIANSARRRPAALAAWAIIPVGLGWFFLWGRLAAG
jgi:hypothetical protein